MAKRILRRPYSFASNGNYPAGASPWSGQPSVVQPVDAILAAGFVPDTPVDAPTVNYLESVKADAITIQGYAAMSTWRRLPFDVNTTRNRFVRPFEYLGVGTASARQRPLALVGHVVSNSHASARFGVDASGALEIDMSGIAAGFNCLAVDRSGNFFGGASIGPRSFTVAPTPVTATITGTGGSGATTAVHFASTHYLLAQDSTVSYATALTGPWTAVTIIPATSTTILQLLDNSYRENAVAPTKVICSLIDNSNSHSKIMVSSDDGITWSLGHDFGVVTLVATWSPAWGVFVAWVNDTTSLWTSVDGTSWTNLGSSSGVTDILVNSAGYSGQIAACGRCIAMIVNHTPATGLTLRGIAYTFDLGLTWQETYFGWYDVASLPILDLVAGNGRFYAVEEQGLYASGILESPNDLYVHD